MEFTSEEVLAVVGALYLENIRLTKQLALTSQALELEKKEPECP